jgi:polyisoprenoid-binding protein YceI
LKQARAVWAAIVFMASAVPGVGLGLAQESGTYDLDAKASRVEIHVFRAGAFSGLGDNHTIELRRFSGEASRSPGDPWHVHVVGESTSLTVLDPNLSDSDRKEVQKTMLGASQLDAARFPHIDIRGRAVRPGEAAGSLRLQADVTLHGQTRVVEFPLAWSQNGKVLSIKGKEQLLLRDFGIEPIRKFFGTIQVRNDFEVVYDIRLIRRD